LRRRCAALIDVASEPVEATLVGQAAQVVPSLQLGELHQVGVTPMQIARRESVAVRSTLPGSLRSGSEQ